MARPSRPSLSNALVVLCEDAFFGVTATRSLSADNLRNLARRRVQYIAGLGPDVKSGLMPWWEQWVMSMCVAMAPIAPPHWLPTADAVDMGLSLEHGARGVRSLFTTKPSEKEVLRVRTTGALAVRVLGAVMSASGPLNAESGLLRGAAIASFGLPEEDQRTLHSEAPIAADALEVYGEIEPKVARAIVKGAFQAAMWDGLDPREEEAVLKISTKLNVPLEAVNDARAEAKQLTDRSKALGDATVDAIRYVLGDEPQDAEKYAIAAARLTQPVVHRRDAITSINVGGAVTLGNKHKLDRKEREAALALAWLSALSSDPNYGRRVELLSRHARIGADLGAEDAAAEARNVIERHIDEGLAQVLALREGSGLTD